jgi:phytoene synthase
LVLMDRSASFAACVDLVRRHDPDRYFSVLFAPKEARLYLMALYAFNYEIARVGENVREPMMGEIRLQWWRETIEGARAGNPRAHDVAQGLAEILSRFDLPQSLFDEMIDARGFDVSPDVFETVGALEDYGAATVGSLIQLAARILGAGERYDQQAREAGIAYALCGVLRAIPHHAARRKLYLPMDLLNTVQLSPDDIFAGQGGEKLKAVMAQLSLRAQNHLGSARAFGRPKRALPAFLPVALAPGYLKLMTRPGFDPFRDPAQVAQPRKQWALLAAATRGKF